MSVKNSPSKERVLGFFDTEVSKYILKDIDKLSEIRPDKTGYGVCAVAHAMMLFAVIDLFGYLIRDNDNPNKKETMKNFQYLMSKKASLFPEKYEDYYKKIVKLFRHGLVHQFFPKASGMSKAGLKIPLMFEDKSGTPILNVDILSKDVVEALERIKKTITEKGNSNLVERINERLDKLAKEDFDTLNKLKGDSDACQKTLE